jgi:hypothetical protein
MDENRILNNIKNNMYFLNKKDSLEKNIKDKYNIDKIEWIENDKVDVTKLYPKSLKYNGKVYDKLDKTKILDVCIGVSSISKNNNCFYSKKCRIHYNKKIYYVIHGFKKYYYGNENCYICIPVIKSNPEFEKIIVNNPKIMNKITGRMNIKLKTDFDNFSFGTYMRVSELNCATIEHKENIIFRNVEFDCCICLMESLNKILVYDYGNKHHTYNIYSNPELILKEKNICIGFNQLHDFTQNIIWESKFVKECTNIDHIYDIVI